MTDPVVDGLLTMGTAVSVLLTLGVLYVVVSAP